MVAVAITWLLLKEDEFGIYHRLERCDFNFTLCSNLLIIIGSQGRNLALGVSGVGSKVWVWSRGSLGVAWYAALHPRAARTRAKRALSASFD